MRRLMFLVLMAMPAHAGEMCVQEALSICCHPNCDVPSFTTASGYSTDGVPCGTFGEFTISASSTDPYQSQGELAEPLGSLYLWVTAGGGYGFRSWSDVTVAGDMLLWQFDPLHPDVHLDPDTPQFATTWTFAAGCFFDAPTLLANLTVVMPPTSVESESESWARIKAIWRSGSRPVQR